MSINVGPSDAARYGWPGAPEGALAAGTTRVARLLARAGARVVGFLPVDTALDPPERVAPLLARVADAQLGFVGEEVAIIDAWPTWPWGEVVAAGDAAAHRMRWLRPRVMEIAPTPCGDATAAAIALENALAARPATLASVLVNLGGYANPGAAPSTVDLLDGVVLLLATRRTRQAAVVALARQLPPKKLLGAILVG